MSIQKNYAILLSIRWYLFSVKHKLSFLNLVFSSSGHLIHALSDTLGIPRGVTLQSGLDPCIEVTGTLAPVLRSTHQERYFSVTNHFQ